jgi:hypothetical protein
MKEMLGNLAEGEIEFYQSVCHSFNQSSPRVSQFGPVNGGVGADYTYHSTYKG